MMLFRLAFLLFCCRLALANPVCSTITEPQKVETSNKEKGFFVTTFQYEHDNITIEYKCPVRVQQGSATFERGGVFTIVASIASNNFVSRQVYSREPVPGKILTQSMNQGIGDIRVQTTYALDKDGFELAALCYLDPAKTDSKTWSASTSVPADFPFALKDGRLRFDMTKCSSA